MAEKHSVTLAIEPMHASFAGEWTFLSTVKDALELIDAVESPCVKLVFDTYHFGLDVCTQRLSESAPSIGIVHLGDCLAAPNGEINRCRLGDGAVPLRKKIIAALLAGGYAGDFDVELLGEEIETADYCELIAHSKAMFERLLDCESLKPRPSKPALDGPFGPYRLEPCQNSRKDPEAAARAGRKADEVTLVGVTKYVDAVIAQALVRGGTV